MGLIYVYLYLVQLPTYILKVPRKDFRLFVKIMTIIL